MQLEDLAVMPRLQNPQLNTAECVIEGHQPDLSATGRSDYIRAILGLSFIFTVLSGPLLALAALYILQVLSKPTGNSNTSIVIVNSAAMYEALKCSSYLFFLVEIILFISSFVFLGGSGPWDIYVILVLIFLEGLLMGLFIEKRSFCSKLLQIVIFLCANWTAYHFCWLMIGVMINPLWGVILLLFICVSVTAFIFAAYHYWYTPREKFSFFAFFLCAAFVLSVWSLFVVVGLAGQSFYGRGTADDIVKLVTLSVTTASFSWIFSIIKKGENSQSRAPEKKPC